MDGSGIGLGRSTGIRHGCGAEVIGNGLASTVAAGVVSTGLWLFSVVVSDQTAVRCMTDQGKRCALIQYPRSPVERSDTCHARGLPDGSTASRARSTKRAGGWEGSSVGRSKYMVNVSPAV